jgi:hypothetical protein
MNDLTELIALARDLDLRGFFKEADSISHNLTERLAYNSGPWNFNIPLENRVVPWDQGFESEMENADESRQDDPRYNPQYYDMTDGSDNADQDGSIFSLNGSNDVPGPAFIEHDPQSAGSYHGDMSSFEYSNREKNDTASDAYKNLLPH